ncbi:hypothetical protein QQ992_13700 [Pseudomonas kurunegalensis]|nr:hypothetical protein [Pseudomonas kurunegalensis]WJD65365.1 hypothetical protein QQ992_13700 [Pseudomonas kurunegalensis]
MPKVIGAPLLAAVRNLGELRIPGLRREFAGHAVLYQRYHRQPQGLMPVC